MAVTIALIQSRERTCIFTVYQQFLIFHKAPNFTVNNNILQKIYMV